MSNIGDRICERRKELGLTQEELAKRLGYKSKSTINKIELGINDITQSKIIMFAEALDTTVAYIMGWEEPKENSFLIEFEKMPRDIRKQIEAYANFLMKNNKEK